MAGTTYQELLDGVASYYGSGSDQWVEIARFGVNADTIPILEQVPGVTITRSNSGKFLGYDYTKPFAGTGNPAAIIDSNVQPGSYGVGSFDAQLPATAVQDSGTGLTILQSGARTTSGAATVAAIADKVALGTAGVALGTKLGKFIDSALYSANPEWWDTHYPTINPETWDDIATTQGGKSVIRSIFGLQDDDTTMYLDERMLAYTYMMLLANGAYGEGSASATIDDMSTLYFQDYPLPVSPVLSISTWTQKWEDDTRENVYQTNAQYTVVVKEATGSNYLERYLMIDTQPFIWQRTGYTPYSGSSISGTTRNGTPFYYANTGAGFIGNHVPYTVGIEPYITGHPNINDVYIDIATIIIDGTITEPSSLDGVSDNPNSSIFINPSTLTNPSTGQPVTPNDDPDDVLQALRNQYPDLFDNTIYEDIPQPDGTTQRITYIPVPYPNITNEAQPITDNTPGVDPQVNPQVNPDTRTPEELQQLTDTLTTETTPPDTGDGDTPAVVIPPGTANALYSIYNPTQGELNSFGAWLWSSNFVDQLLKLFNDPMQAIIGLHKVFAPPGISGTSTIKVGYLDSGVSSNVIGSQYTTVDCGEIEISEYFGNVFDYDPFTCVYIYLPFIGIEKLDTGDVMRGRLRVVYHVDVLTGACLAEIRVTRDGAGGTLYTFTGNCAVQYPISSGSYMGIVASIASVAGGVVGTIASGGALAPVAMGAVNGVLNAHTRVQHSGGFSGNAGAMGIKTPYVIITRPQTCLADNFPAFNGYPANHTTTLSACSGFVKCETCHVENIPATDAELSEIEMLLKSGVII